MAQQVVIAGAMFEDVPSISVPDANNVYHPFLDTTIASNAATAADITNGKQAYVNGALITGTNSGGGGGGLEYETGTWTPASDIADYTITFSKTHSESPFFYMVVDSGTDYFTTTNTNFAMVMFSPYLFCNAVQYASSGTFYYGYTFYRYRASNSTTFSSANATMTSTIALESWATSTGIRAYTGGSTRYWRSGRTYKWIAAWAPTS